VSFLPRLTILLGAVPLAQGRFHDWLCRILKRNPPSCIPLSLTDVFIISRKHFFSHAFRGFPLLIQPFFNSPSLPKSPPQGGRNPLRAPPFPGGPGSASSPGFQTIACPRCHLFSDVLGWFGFRWLCPSPPCRLFLTRERTSPYFSLPLSFFFADPPSVLTFSELFFSRK